MPVVGPDARGVIVATPDPRAAAMDVLTLRAAGIEGVTATDLGLRLVEAAGGGSPEAAAGTWSLATRRPVIVREGRRLAVGGPDGSAEVLDPPTLSSDLVLGVHPPRRVAVFGGAWIGEGEEGHAEAVELGRRAAEAGVHVVCGGYAGVMEAVSRGAAEAGGVAVGVSIAAWEGVVAPNDHLTHHLVAADLLARFPLLLDADVWVAYPGGVGTLAEVALGWNLMQMSVRPRPLVLVGEGWAEVLATLRERLLVTDPAHLELVRVVGPDEAIEAVLEDVRA